MEVKNVQTFETDLRMIRAKPYNVHALQPHALCIISDKRIDWKSQSSAFILCLAIYPSTNQI